ncbi:lantibiotic immunity ABC transporter MutE/EpiE family permease subunit [Anaerovorax odorimutans]|uniref:lantibiotic immunity ABC transporter MutE/EpiE family permease subunit n=1 Tax=Anaerovorax odorimutans TaxID=109327 RepID=UPI0003F96633|nr:lantibiotic immunity ABC transporter MutE/EpiE family permease subunit [Anaerovorax odorimutans]
MLNFVKSEWLKQKHSFNKVLLWLAPLITILLAFALMGGSNLQNGAYNWWYTTLLPGCFTMFCAFTAAREQKTNRHGLFGVAVQKNKLWNAQTILCTLFLFTTCMIFFIGITAGGMMLGHTITIVSSFCASILLFITFAWQIPLWMFVTEKLGAFTAILFSLLCNLGIAVVCAVKSFWWVPFAIPARLMSPTIGVLPNGLQVEAGSEMANANVILPGVLITVVLYVLVTLVTSLWFQKREV